MFLDNLLALYKILRYVCRGEEGKSSSSRNNSLGVYVCDCVLVAQSCLTFTIPWTISHQAPLSIEFSRQEYWSGLPFPSPGDLPNPGMEPPSLVSSALAGRFFTTEPFRKPI